MENRKGIECIDYVSPLWIIGTCDMVLNICVLWFGDVTIIVFVDRELEKQIVRFEMQVSTFSKL